MEKQEKVVSFPCRGRTNLRIYSWYSLSDFKCDEKRFIRIPSLNVPEMRHLVNFIKRLAWKQWLLENFGFSFGSVFPISVNVQSFITFVSQEKKSSIIKIFKCFFLTTLSIQFKNQYKKSWKVLIDFTQPVFQLIQAGECRN